MALWSWSYGSWIYSYIQRRIQGEGGVKSWFFTWNTPTISRAPPKIGKIWFFLRKIVIFHTKYLKNVRASLRSAQFFEVRPPTWNPGSAPDICSQCLSPLMLWVWILITARCTTLCGKKISELRLVRGFPQPIKLTTTI
jgi:hypothetical protein